MANGEVAAASTATEATLAKQRYVGRADRVCAASSARINDVLSRVFPGAPDAGMRPDERDAWVVQHLAPIIRAEIADLRSIPPPPGDEATVGAIYEGMEQALGAVERNPAAIRAFGQGTPDDPFAAPAQRAGDYGLSVCALGSPEAD
jgi:hypothetical protein